VFEKQTKGSGRGLESSLSLACYWRNIHSKGGKVFSKGWGSPCGTGLPVGRRDASSRGGLQDIRMKKWACNVPGNPRWERAVPNGMANKVSGRCRKLTRQTCLGLEPQGPGGRGGGAVHGHVEGLQTSPVMASQSHGVGGVAMWSL
jgi:hypothetical protein